MYRRLTTLIIACVGFCSGASAQTIIEGNVTDSLGRAVDAYVTVGPKGTGNILGFADTDTKGHYRLKFTTQADSVTVTASGLAIGNQVKIVPNRSQRLDFRVKEQSVQLKEVSVRAQKIRQHGDTLSYLVGAYQQQGDRVIGDVLKRMPGIEVADNGGIKYNGKSIKKFYVEEMDLLQGRYGLATNNINASDVATVQVLENHQPVKMLQGKELTDDVAINLKLKDSAKGTVAVNTMLGGGWEPTPSPSPKEGSLVTHESSKLFSSPSLGEGIGVGLWTAEVVGMYFAKRRQNMTLYKGNNTGDDVSKELTQHYSSINSVGLYPFCPTATVMPSGSGLPQKRTFDNHSHILTLNHLEKPNKDTELGLNIAYHNDRIRREGSSVDDRFLSDDSRLLTTETMTSETKVNNLNVQARYNWNATNGFIANVLKFDTNWNSDRVDGTMDYSYYSPPSREGSGGGSAVHQHFDRPQLTVSNTFNTIRNIGKNTFDLHFSAGYSHRPNTLTVGIEEDPPLTLPVREGVESIESSNPLKTQVTTPSLTGRVGGGSCSQDVNSHHIAGRFNTSYGIRVADVFKFSYGISASANLHGIVTDLDGFTPPAEHNQLSNDLWYNTYCLALGQSYKYETPDLDITLGLPLELYTQTLDDKIRKDKHGYTHLLFFPSLSVNWTITRDLWLNGGASYSKTVGDPGGIYSGYIMSNYRAFQRSYVEQLSETKNYGANVGLRYRSAIRALFANIGFNYRRTHDNQIYGYNYEGATSVVQAVNQPTTASNYSLSGEASKGFDFLRSTIRVFGSYGLSESERLISQSLYQYHAQGLSFGGSLSFSPFEWIGIVYSSGFAQSRSYTEGRREQATTVRSNTQRLSMSVYPTKTLTLTLAAEDNYNNLTAENRHAWFGDATAKLKLKHIDLELQLNNLFDQRQYTRVNYSGLDIYTNTSQLRPRNIIGTIRFKLL